MGHVKLIMPGSQDFGESAAKLIKMAGSGLYGNDLGTFIKRAGHKMADAVQKISFSPGEIPIHVIAIGATEFYGPNRNGDGFTEECCRRYHDTFVKHARWYRNHQNKDTSKSYGIIKHSDYNETMHRLELIVALNGTKEAAIRNGGLLADEELKDLSAGKDMPVSMACKVAYDVCSICGNRARTKADYCTADTCPGGGCADNLCKVADDGSITFVDNPFPTWFDMSKVLRGADRIAFSLGTMQKVASHTVSSAELAHQLGVTAPLDLEITHISDRKIREQIKLAARLAEIEKDLLAGHEKTAAAMPVVRVELQGLNDAGRDPSTRAQVLKALAQEKVAMSLTDFIQFTSGYPRQRAEMIANEIRPNMYGLFGRMCDDVEKLAEDLSRNPFKASEIEPDGKWTMWAKKQASTASLDRDSICRKAWTHAIRDETISLDLRDRGLIKAAANDGLAKAYGIYKLSFLHEIMEIDPDFNLTTALAVRQNYIT